MVLIIFSGPLETHGIHKTVGSMTGGFICDESFTKTQNSNDWMTASGNYMWTVTLYSVTGGDVESEDINASEFSN